MNSNNITGIQAILVRAIFGSAKLFVHSLPPLSRDPRYGEVTALCTGRKSGTIKVALSRTCALKKRVLTIPKSPKPSP